MNEKIANILKTRIETLPFVEKISGLVRPVKVQIPGKDNIPVLKTFPVSTDISNEQCISGHYRDLTLNSKYRSVIYFEDNGSNITYLNGRWVGLSGKITLVGWLNLSLMMDCGNYTGSTEVILSILSTFPQVPINDGNYREIRITALSEVPKSNAIFSRYTYDELTTQYLLYPYDYFALNVSVDYKVNLACVQEFELGSCKKC